MVPVLGTLSIVWAILELPPLQGHWLPVDVSADGPAIDHIFNIILYLTGAIFIGTGLALAWFMWKYGEHNCDKQVDCSHGSRKLEATWSIIPGLILIFLSFYQINVWEDHKMKRPTELVDGVEVPQPPLARVKARQFGWQFQYAGYDRLLDTPDDIVTETVFVIPRDTEIVVEIESEDVLHSFFMPNLRVKQDIVPGMLQYCWFKAKKTGQYDIACAELCGWGHYKMRGRMTVLEPDAYTAWFEEEFARQQQTTLDPLSEF
jgi:cytochrome c oxidase subunit 2